MHLAGSRDVVAGRLASRLNHFMPTTLLDSQFTTLEPLGEDERHITVDVGRAPEEEVAEIVEILGLR